MIKLRLENLRRSRGEFPKEMRLSLAEETIELMGRHVPIRNIEGRRGAASPFSDLGVRILCAVLSGDVPEMDDVADALSRVLGDDDEELESLDKLAENVAILSRTLCRRVQEMTWALSEIPP